MNIDEARARDRKKLLVLAIFVAVFLGDWGYRSMTGNSFAQTLGMEQPTNPVADKTKVQPAISADKDWR